MTLLSSQRILASRGQLAGPPVLTVGGANVEHVYEIPGAFEPDKKYTSAPLPRFAGGSSVNHTTRLLALGVDVHPVLPLAKSDPMSQIIIDALEESARLGDADYKRRSLAIRGENLTTPFTTIIRQLDSRAALNEFSPGLMEKFRDHVDRHLAAIGKNRRRPRIAMIGHIHADRRKPGRGEIGFRGEITESVLKSTALGEAKTFVNFGRAQYGLGAKHWQALLRDHVDVFQLDLGEAREFCRDVVDHDASLESILTWFRERSTVVISLGRYGAIGQLRGSMTPIAAWPFQLDHPLDATGAGDAMGAGIVASMLVDPFDDESDRDSVRIEKFSEALAFGRVCGTFACTTPGGAAHCPPLEGLAKFERRVQRRKSDEASVRPVSAHELSLIDRAFDQKSPSVPLLP